MTTVVEWVVLGLGKHEVLGGKHVPVPIGALIGGSVSSAAEHKT
jgi:hypothetical protein